ncbi:MAG: isoleucyl-tRNA synthetase, partial [Rhodothermales bacterium]
MFSPVDSRANFPAEERKILEFWEQEQIFQQSLDQRKDGPEFVF